ncbi:hypothetical protein AOLI_G00320640 [Acnodon oligacanthus]
MRKWMKAKSLTRCMIAISDGIHNIMDGLAIGTAFSLSWRSGLITPLAALCRDLPRKLGNLSTWRKPTQTWGKHVPYRKDPGRPSRELNPGPSCCELPMLPTVVP